MVLHEATTLPHSPSWPRPPATYIANIDKMAEAGPLEEKGTEAGLELLGSLAVANEGGAAPLSPEPLPHVVDEDAITVDPRARPVNRARRTTSERDVLRIVGPKIGLNFYKDIGPPVALPAGRSEGRKTGIEV